VVVTVRKKQLLPVGISSCWASRHAGEGRHAAHLIQYGGNPEAAPGADAYYPLPMAELPGQLKVTRRTYLVVTSRGSNVDAAGLPNLLKSEAAYIGVIGSKRRWMTTVKALKEQGISDDLIGKVHSPMGLELNAETPEEIAVSIMAEILMLRDRGTGRMMKE
jgi:xanthine dehydrogenase accessory factor